MWVIKDWADNLLLNGMLFSSFQDAWGYIYGELTDRLNLTEDDYQEYFVERTTHV